MITSYPASLASAAAAGRTLKSPAPKSREAAPPGSWRYDCRPQSRRILILAALISGALHAAFLFGFGHARQKPAAPKAEAVIMVSLVMPAVRELDEPEPEILDDAEPLPDLGELVPMQQDLPQMPRPSDFVQQMNFASLIDPPDFSHTKMTTVPDHIRTAGRLAEKFGKIFDLSALDRVPEPVFQPSPIYPVALKREGIKATVEVTFIVDSTGRVRSPFVTDSSDSRFEEAAMTGVAKWRFRPGFKAGHKVNTRMRVPVIFHVGDGD